MIKKFCFVKDIFITKICPQKIFFDYTQGLNVFLRKSFNYRKVCLTKMKLFDN
jgi:hypothetical protein